jgi:hypothetical protein
MGWDAFGLPAENYAIKMGVHPEKSTAENIRNIKRQIQEIAAIYDWDMEVNTIYNFFIGKTSLTGWAPVNWHLFLISKSGFKHFYKNPLCPFVEFRIGGIYFHIMQ